MNWGFTLYGQPPSWDDSYKIVRKWRHGPNGKIPYHGLAKKEKTVAYQSEARLIIGAAKPSKWKPTGFVRVWLTFYLVNDMDCDNAMKAIHDVIEDATGVDDIKYLPVAVWKEIGCTTRDARVEVVIEHPASPLQVPPI